MLVLPTHLLDWHVQRLLMWFSPPPLCILALLNTICMFFSAELKQYLPPLDELMTKLDEVNAFCQGQVAAMQTLGPQDAKIRFIGNRPSPPLILFPLLLSAF